MFVAGGKSGLLQGGWLLTGAVREDWKVPQKLYGLPEREAIVRHVFGGIPSAMHFGG